MKVKIDVKVNTDKIKNKFRFIRKRKVERATQDLARILRKVMVEKDVIATGLMYKMVKADPHKGVVYINVPYAYYVNYGTRPHIVPLRKLYIWARAKFKVNEKAGWKIARVVQAKIMMYGTRPRFFIEDAVQILENRYKGEVKFRWK